MPRYPRPSSEEFEKVCDELEHMDLNVIHLGRIFGLNWLELLTVILTNDKFGLPRGFKIVREEE